MNLLYKALAALGIGAVMFAGGYFYGGHVRGQADDLKAAQAQLSAQAKYLDAVKDGNEREARLLRELDLQSQLYAALKKEAALEKFVFVGGAPVSLASVDLSRSYVGLWNAALLGSTAPAAPAGPAGEAEPSGITPADLLANHVENSERCDRIARQLSALIDWEQRQ